MCTLCSVVQYVADVSDALTALDGERKRYATLEAGVRNLTRAKGVMEKLDDVARKYKQILSSDPIALKGIINDIGEILSKADVKAWDADTRLRGVAITVEDVAHQVWQCGGIWSH